MYLLYFQLYNLITLIKDQLYHNFPELKYIQGWIIL